MSRDALQQKLSMSKTAEVAPVLSKIAQEKLKNARITNQMNNMLSDLQDNQKALVVFMEEFRKQQAVNEALKSRDQENKRLQQQLGVSKSQDGTGNLAKLLLLGKKKREYLLNHNQVDSQVSRNSRFGRLHPLNLSVNFDTSTSPLRSSKSTNQGLSTYAQDKSKFSNAYYHSFIHQTNKQLMVASSQVFKRKTFINEDVARANDKKRRFDAYMEVMDESRDLQPKRLAEIRAELERAPMIEPNQLSYKINRVSMQDIVEKTQEKEMMKADSIKKNQLNQSAALKMPNTSILGGLLKPKKNLLLDKLGVPKKTLKMQFKDGLKNILSKEKDDMELVQNQAHEMVLQQQASELNFLKHSQTGLTQVELETMKSSNLLVVTQNQNQIAMKKVSFAVYLDNLKKLKDKIQGEHFKIICTDLGNNNLQASLSSPSKDQQFRNARLTKAKLKNFLSLRYGPQLAEKFCLIFDFSTPVDFQSYMSQLENFLKSKELMTQLAFDLYDQNNDNRISENDLFRIFRFFEVSSLDEAIGNRGQNIPQVVFEKAFQRDLCTMIKFMQSRRQARAQLESSKQLKAAEGDISAIAKADLLDPAAKYFRNLNVADVEFESKKRKIFKALYDMKQDLKKKKDKRVSISSKDQTITSEITHKSVKEAREEEKKAKEEALLRYHNDEDFFNNVFHNHMRRFGKSSNRYNNNAKSQEKNGGGAQADSQELNLTAALEDRLAGSNGRAGSTLIAKNYALNNYIQQRKIFRMNAAIVADGDNQEQDQQDSQMFDEYFGLYMEDIQKKQNEYMTFEDFNRLQFINGDVAFLIIDFIDYITGTKDLFVKVLTQNLSIQAQKHTKQAPSEKSGLLQRYDSTAALTNASDQEETYSHQKSSQINLTSQGQIKGPPSSSYPPLTNLPKDYDKQLLRLRFNMKPDEFLNVAIAFMLLAGIQPPLPHLTQYIQGTPVVPPLTAFQNLMLNQWQQYLLGAQKPGFADWLALTEESIIENFPKVFGGFSCNIMGKLIYLYLSKGADFAMINFARFVTAFMPILSDYSEVRGQVPFHLLDIDGDGLLNILNILQVHHNLTSRSVSGKRSLFAIELRKIFHEYKEKNLHLRDGFRHQMVLNQSTYMKLVPHSCLIDELRLRLFGAIPSTSTIFGTEYQSPFDSVPDHFLVILEPQGDQMEEGDTTLEEGEVALKKQHQWKASQAELLSEQQYEKLFYDRWIAPKASHLIKKLR